MDDIITAVKNGGWLAPKNKIPAKYLPDWQEEYYLSYSSAGFLNGYLVAGYCMAYFPASSFLFICERYYR